MQMKLLVSTVVVAATLCVAAARPTTVWPSRWFWHTMREMAMEHASTDSSAASSGNRPDRPDIEGPLTLGLKSRFYENEDDETGSG